MMVGMKLSVDIPDGDVAGIDDIARRRRRSRAEIIAMALSQYLKLNRRSSLDEALGLWGDAGVDGLDYQRRLRGEW